MRIKGFVDFRADRSATIHMAAKASADLLWYLDSAIGAGGHSETPDPEYQAFREWYSQRVQETALGLIANLLGSLDVDRGLASLKEYKAAEAPEFDRVASRLAFLVEEIPSLQDRYGQLFPDEVDPMLEDVNSAILAEERGEQIRLLGELEKWYAYAQQGMRLFRNDADERAAFDQWMEAALAKAEAERAAEEAVAETGTGTEAQRAAARERLLRQKAGLEAGIVEAQKAVAEDRAELERVLGQLGRLG